MSATTLPTDREYKVAVPAGASPLYLADQLMRAAASLKLTVTLFAFAIFIVLIGTLAQTEADIWQVVRDYFHAWIMWVDVNLLFPKSFFPSMPHIPLPAIPFPGGMTVGLLMIVNLLAAHGWRFKVQAEGTRLFAGLAVTAIGVALTTLVIIAGQSGGGFQAQPPFTWAQLWGGLQVVLSAGWLAAGAAYVMYGLAPTVRERSLTWVRLLVLGLLLAALLIGATLLFGTIFRGWYPGDEGMRILWQLTQGGLAGIVLLIGCILIFQKRGGMVLLHAGIGLMMFNELWVARQAVEWQVFLQEGQATNYLRDIRTTELAIIDPSGKETDEHIVVPRQLLEQNLSQNRKLLAAGKPLVTIADPQHLLPFQVAVMEYFRNSDVRTIKEGEQATATKGRGLKEALVELPVAKGTDTDSGVDFAGTYVRLSGQDGKDLGTYLVSQLASEQKNPGKFAEKVTVGDKTYDLFLRFKRAYKPYTIELVDVRKDDYVASDTPRNYSSDIRLKDESKGVDQPVHIKMNNPLRYANDTLYQSGYHPPAATGDKEATTLAVVRNTGWMIPYVACMLVATGMLAHFLITVTRFLDRRGREELSTGDTVIAEVVDPRQASPAKARKARPAKPPPGSLAPRQFPWATTILCLAAALIFVAYVGSAAREKKSRASEFDFARFGKLPVAHMGRVKPMDTLARNSLRALSLREQIKTKDAAGKRRYISANQWLLDVVTGSEEAIKYQVIRIDHPEILKLFELERRSGYLYSIEEIREHIDRFERQIAAIGKLKPDEMNIDQKKLLELDERLKLYITLVRAFSPPDLPPLPTEKEFSEDRALAQRRIDEFRMAVFKSTEEIKQMKAPRTIPLTMPSGTSDEEHWHAYPSAWTMAFMKTRILGEEPDPTTEAFNALLDAYRRRDVGEFNKEVARYENLLAKTPPPLWDAEKVDFEAYFNHFSPFYVGMPLYVLGFILAIFGWLFRYKPLNWAAFTLIALTFCLHFGALCARMYISGRPPVTNLYSSAVFIGTGCVLMGLILEAIFRIGIGNVVAAWTGFSSLLIAYFLSAGGDTITVLQAVLDTQFWLATHVTCITLGYAATYMAGFLGLLFVLCGMASPLLGAQTRKELARMIYGVVCFAIFFSFVGTVLGGLWADDSWGRFWGWDPKENGALIIVLWNALVLHARWDKMIGDRGLAVLAIGGNIVTSWSWFGVNELGIGLHSYGFTEGVLLALGVFVGSQLLVIIAGCLPTSLWWSYAAERDAKLA